MSSRRFNALRGGGEPMPECDGCGAHVTPDYWRVFSAGGELAACVHCSSRREAREAVLKSESTE